MRRGFFVPSRCRLPERQRKIFPVEVSLNRLAAPRCVFNFIFLFFFTIPSSIQKLVLCARRLRRPRRSRSAALFRSQQRQQDICFHPRTEFHQRVVRDFLQQTLHLRPAHVLVRHLAAAMENHGLHFVAFAQEPYDLVLAHLEIMLGGRRPKLHFLYMAAFLVPLRFMRFLALLVLKLAVIDQLADRGHGVRRNLDHVQAGIPRRLHRVEQGHHAHLIPRFIHHAYFPSAYAFVDPKARRTTTFRDKTTSGARNPSSPPDFPPS